MSCGFEWDICGKGKQKEPISSLTNSSFSGEATGLRGHELLSPAVDRFLPRPSKALGYGNDKFYKFRRRQVYSTDESSVSPVSSVPQGVLWLQREVHLMDESPAPALAWLWGERVPSRQKWCPPHPLGGMGPNPGTQRGPVPFWDLPSAQSFWKWGLRVATKLRTWCLVYWCF